MEVEKFWSLIDDVKARSSSDPDGRADALYQELSKLAPSDIAAFQRHLDEAVKKAYRWDLWGAAYVMNGGCSDDSFLYFLRWLSSEGRATYEEALRDPDSLASLPRMDFAEDESFGYAAVRAYEEKDAGELERDFSIELQMPSGEEWEESELPEMFPKLAALYEFSA